MYNKLELWKKIFIGMAAGIIVGALIGQHANHLKPIGDLFINAIKMLVVPLVFCSLVSGVTSLQDTKKMGRIGGKSFALYASTSFLAIIIGMLLASITHPGLGMSLATTLTASSTPPVESFSFVNMLANIIPSNPINALASGDMLQLIIFAIILGVAINLAGKDSQPLVPLFQAGASAMYKLTSLIMQLAPYGVFALMAWLTGTYGLATLLPLVKLIVVMYLGYLSVALIIYIPILITARLSPLTFFKNTLDAIIIAFTTSSSAAALPISMSCATKKLGVSPNVSSFLLPLGATINMNGTALYQGICVLFLAQAYGIDLSFTQCLIMAFTALLAAIGTAGVPGGGIVMLSLVLSAGGVPLEGIALIAAIDRILDMGRSTFNVLGDLVTATIVAKSEKEFNITTFNHSTQLPIQGDNRMAIKLKQYKISQQNLTQPVEL